MADLSAYADALGIKPSRGDPAPGSGIVTADQQRPDSRFPDGSASGPGGSMADLKASLANPRIPADAKAALAAELARMQPQGSDLSPYAAALGITQAAAPQPAPQAPVGQPGTNAGIPDAVAPSGSGNTEPTWWQKAKGAASAATAMTTGAIGGMVAGAANIATLPGDLANGRSHQPLDQAFAAGQDALTYTPTDQGSQDVASSILNSKIVQSLPAVGAVAPTIAPMVRPGSMQAMQDSFAARGKPAAARIEPVIAEAPAGLAQATPELQQAFAAATAKGGRIDPTIAARHIEADTLAVPIKLTKGQATLDPTLISEEMNGRGKGSQAAVPPEFYKEQGQRVAQNMEAMRATAAPEVPATANIVDHGQALIDSYKQMDGPVKADITAKYKALSDANGGALPLNGQDFVKAADAALSKQMKGRYVPAAVAGDLEQFRAGGPMTFEQFENLRTNLAAEARKADRQGDGNAAGAVNIVRNTLEALPMTEETAAIKPLADAARQAAAARFAAIKSDPAYKAAIGDSAGLGEPSPLADKFFNSYVTKGAKANVALMREHLGDDALAAQTIAAGTLDQLRAQLKADPETGNFSQAGYNKALQAVSPKLDSLLDAQTAKQVQALGNTTKIIQTQPRGSYVNNSNTTTSYLAEKAKDVAEHGVNIMSGGIPTGSIGRAIGGRILAARGARKATNDALAPAAGITRLSDFPK